MERIVFIYIFSETSKLWEKDCDKRKHGVVKQHLKKIEECYHRESLERNEFLFLISEF